MMVLSLKHGNLGQSEVYPSRPTANQRGAIKNLKPIDYPVASFLDFLSFQV